MAVDLAPAVDADVTELVAKMRSLDIAEVRAAHGESISAVLLESVARSITPLTARADGRLLAIFGHAPVGPILTPAAAPWLLGTDLLTQHASDLVRLSRAYVSKWRKQFPLLANFVDARNLPSIRYLKAVGFNIDEASPFGVEGLPFHRFHLGLADSV